MTPTLREENQLRVSAETPHDSLFWGQPAYTWLAISNYSPLKEHSWVRGIDLPFEIVLLPGYSKPKALNVDDIDAIWFEGEVTAPLVVWDGDFSDNLFEMISMCMDPAAEMVNYIRVRRKGSSNFIDDPRPLEMLKSRPQKTFDGDIISYRRSEDRERYVSEELMQYYREWQSKTLAWCMSGGMSICYDDRNRKSLRHAKVHWKNLVDRHPDVDKRILTLDVPICRSVSGMMFGYDKFQQEMSKHPDWMPKQLELDYLIETDEEFVRTPYQQVSFKQDRGIPLTAEDQKILRKGGDYATPGVRSFLNKFHTALRRG